MQGTSHLSFLYAPKPGSWYNVSVVLKDDPEAYAIMGCARRVHAMLGFGFLESAYGDALEIEFRKSGIPYVREDAVRIYYDGQPLPTVWRADFTCFERRFIVELKAVKALTKIEWAQVIHYLRATRIPTPCSSTSADQVSNTTPSTWTDSRLDRSSASRRQGHCMAMSQAVVAMRKAKAER